MRILTDISVSFLAGGMIGTGLVAAYFINARTKKQALQGTSQQKLIAYSQRICAVVGAYVVILLSAKAMNAYTDKTVLDALVFVGSLAGILFVARNKFRQGPPSKSSIL
jgi:hypothetical protein